MKGFFDTISQEEKSHYKIQKDARYFCIKKETERKLKIFEIFLIVMVLGLIFMFVSLYFFIFNRQHIFYLWTYNGKIPSVGWQLAIISWGIFMGILSFLIVLFKIIIFKKILLTMEDLSSLD